MKRLTQLLLVGALLLVVVSLASAQQALQPVVRLGNFIEVGNDVWMHIIATADMRYNTVENLDFEKRIRENHESQSDLHRPA